MEHAQRNCDHCCSPFIGTRSDQIYCGKSCGSKAASKRKHEIFKQLMKQDKICEWCEQSFSPFFYMGAKQRFCSVKCKDEINKALKREATLRKLTQTKLICRYCESGFKATRTGQQFCSSKCKTKQYAEEQKSERDRIRNDAVRQCPICDILFTPKKTLKEIYCSKKCREAVGKKIYKMMQSCYEATNTSKSDHSHEVLGYTPNQLLERLQTFPQWEGLKNKSWHLDHIFPIVAFTRKDIKDVSLICRLDNLQPLAGPSNCKKKDKYDEAEFEEWLNAALGL